MAISKVVYGNTTLIDISEDTVNAAAMLSGVTAHKSNGEAITGNINIKTSADLSASGSIVTVPSGYYAAAASTAIAAGSVSIEDQELTLEPSISVSSSGKISFYQDQGSIVYPSTTSGYVSSTPTFYVHATAQASYQLDTQAAAAITPSESTQIAIDSGKFTTGVIQVAAISSDYVGTAVPHKDSDDLTVFGATITAPAGYYSAAASTTIAAGSFSALPVTTTPAIGTISINSSTGVITVSRSSHIVSNAIQANATQAGYISANTSSKNDLTIGASSTTYALSTLSATTYTPSSVTQTIAAGVYLTGSQTIEPIPIGVIEHRLILPEGLIGV